MNAKRVAHSSSPIRGGWRALPGRSGGGVNYTYDGDGDRVQKSNGKIYWYGAGSEILDETDATGSTTNATFSEYVYFDGKRVARRDYQSNHFYYFSDQVGSARGMFEVVSGSHTATPCFDADFYPYGGEHDYVNTCPQNYKFMGKERDPETNNDDFGARSYASAYGRFLSADWSSTPTPVPYANLTNPQTLNLYAMVSDNPESFADLDGHECCDWLKQQVNSFVTGVEKGILNFDSSTLGKMVPAYAEAIGTSDIAGARTPPETPSNATEAVGMATAEATGQAALVGLAGLAGGAEADRAATAAVPDANVVVRGGQGDMPPTGSTFSGAHGATLEEAASGVPHGTIRDTTAGAVREGGGTVASAPERTRSGTMNEKHVNITEGTTKPSTFSKPKPNPVPKKDRVQ